jgi:hypothetical protein
MDGRIWRTRVMPKSKDREHEHRPKHEHEQHRHPEREPEESGDDPLRHASIIARRWLGSPPPTAERYALALRQWQSLPGAVSKPPVDLTGSADTPAAPNACLGPTYSADEVSES